MGDGATRAYPRFAIDADIEVRTGSLRATGRTANISRGGLCVDLDRPIAHGADLEIAITLVFDDQGHSEPLVLRARAMWSTAIDDRFQVGCHFAALQPRDTAFLEMFLRYLEGGAAHDEPDATRPLDDPFG